MEQPFHSHGCPSTSCRSLSMNPTTLIRYSLASKTDFGEITFTTVPPYMSLNIRDARLVDSLVFSRGFRRFPVMRPTSPTEGMWNPLIHSRSKNTSRGLDGSCIHSACIACICSSLGECLNIQIAYLEPIQFAVHVIVKLSQTLKYNSCCWLWQLRRRHFEIFGYIGIRLDSRENPRHQAPFIHDQGSFKIRVAYLEYGRQTPTNSFLTRCLSAPDRSV